jgi:hypothetical protein
MGELFSFPDIFFCSFKIIEIKNIIHKLLKHIFLERIYRFFAWHVKEKVVA